MYITSPDTTLSEFKVLCRLQKIESPFLYLTTTTNNQFKIKYNNLHKYTTNNLLLVTIQKVNEELVEKYVDEIDGDMNDTMFCKVVDAMKNYNEIF